MFRKAVLWTFGALAALTLGTSGALACTATGYNGYTAALVATGDVVNQTVDGTGCDVGIYYGPGTSGTVDNVDVSGATDVGILISGDATAGPGATSVDITNSTVEQIGDSPLSGAQHGYGIEYIACSPGASATGTISGNTVSSYQKNGVIARCPGTAVSISSNAVVGSGPVTRIAQNGIEVIYGASAQVMRNTVTGNAYTGANDASSSGILVFGGCGAGPLTTGVQIVKNIVGGTGSQDGNDIGVALANYGPYDATNNICSSPTTPTNNKVVNNTIANAEQTNLSGNCASPCTDAPYQAGILDSGVNDKLINNTISGEGYTDDPPGYYSIDNEGTATKVHANVVP